MKNPVAVGDVSTKAGLALYIKNCASCHGKAGLGDGVWATALRQELLRLFQVIFQILVFRNRVMVICSIKPKPEEMKCLSMKANWQMRISGILLTI